MHRDCSPVRPPLVPVLMRAAQNLVVNIDNHWMNRPKKHGLECPLSVRIMLWEPLAAHDLAAAMGGRGSGDSEGIPGVMNGLRKQGDGSVRCRGAY